MPASRCVTQAKCELAVLAAVSVAVAAAAAAVGCYGVCNEKEACVCVSVVGVDVVSVYM